MSFMSDPSSSTGGQPQSNTTQSTTLHVEPLGILPNEGAGGQPNSFTEQELGEYKEQDRYLPVRLATAYAKIAHVTSQDTC